jgi:hypothetical protein
MINKNTSKLMKKHNIYIWLLSYKKKSEKHVSMMYSASVDGRLDIIKYLIFQNDPVYINKTSVELALCCAAENNHLEIVKYLVAMNVNVKIDDDCPVRYASEKGHLEIVKYLISLGTNIRACNDYAIRWAASNGQAINFIAKAIKLMVDRKNGFAIFPDHLEMVKYLILMGANCDLAIKWASYSFHDNSEVVNYLVSVGAKLGS